jgi:hypothetical protein
MPTPIPPYRKGDLIGARGGIARVERVCTDADLIEDGDPDLVVVDATVIDEMRDQDGVLRHGLKSTVYILLDEIDWEATQESAA